MYADVDRLSKEGRSFSCASCPEATKRARRCMEDRWDFTEADGNAFPVYINPPSDGGDLYGFCPGKVLRDDPFVSQIFRLLMIATETGAMLKTGGLEDQPDWFVELLGWFIPRIDTLRFSSKVRSVLGGKGSQADKTKALYAQAQRGSRGSNSRRSIG